MAVENIKHILCFLIESDPILDLEILLAVCSLFVYVGLIHQCEGPKRWWKRKGGSTERDNCFHSSHWQAAGTGQRKEEDGKGRSVGGGGCQSVNTIMETHSPSLSLHSPNRMGKAKRASKGILNV